MKVTEKNQGKKIPYTLEGNVICFQDSLSLNLAAYEKDDGNYIGIFADRQGCLLCTGGPEYRYVAEIIIPARRYRANQRAVYEGDLPVVVKTPVPFEADACTLVLWAVE